jgi:hypothetical protein
MNCAGKGTSSAADPEITLLARCMICMNLAASNPNEVMMQCEIALIWKATFVFFFFFFFFFGSSFYIATISTTCTAHFEK